MSFFGGYDPFGFTDDVMQAMAFGIAPRQYNGQPTAQLRQAQRGPVIQEVDDNDVHAYPAAQRPTVEEPEEDEDEDEEPAQQQATTHPRPTARAPHPLFQLQPFDAMPSLFDSMLSGAMFPAIGGASSYSYSSYSSSSGGHVTYSRTTTTRVGPNGVAETTESVHDGRTGEQRSRVARRLGDREHVVSTARDTRGVQERQEVLNNIRDDADRQRFEQEWSRAAPRSLLGTRERSNSLRGAQFERSVQPRLEYQGWM